jgi:hypothetical protein
MSSSDEKTRIVGGFRFGFGAAIGWFCGSVVIIIIVFKIIPWLAEGLSQARFDSLRAYSSDRDDPNADNVPPGFYIIKR